MSANGILKENLVLYNTFLFYINFLDFLLFMQLVGHRVFLIFPKKLVVLTLFFINLFESTIADLQLELLVSFLPYFYEKI